MFDVKRFQSLDTLRGVAALSVVIWHWQHFYDFRSPAFRHTEQPLYSALSMLYVNGWRAVDLFFCLSGFVFHWLYADRVGRGQISAHEFFVLRFSRLYPLHLATLLALALAYAFIAPPAVYKFNDGYHFALNLFLASSIGLERGFSFNGPAWSVSVEALLYALFFAGYRLTQSRLLICALGVLAGIALWPYYDPVARGLVAFFAGGAVYALYRSMPPAAVWPIPAAVACWAATIVQAYVARSDISEFTADAWSIFVLFPVTVLALVVAESRRGELGRRFAFLGDISYSSYLLQFPLQLVFMRTFTAFDDPATMALFFAALIALSAASYRFFEKPAQRWLRQKLLRRRAGPLVGSEVSEASR